jgi:hypothetical protein
VVLAVLVEMRQPYNCGADRWTAEEMRERPLKN